MEKFTKLFIGLFFVGSLLISCDKDKDNDSSGSYMKIGDTEYSLSQGTIENYGADTGYYDGYNLDLYLFSDGFTVTTDEEGDMAVSGSGNVIYFETFSSQSDAFDNGDYVYDTINYTVKTFDYGDFCLDCSAESDNNNWIEMTGGTVNIQKSGDTYSITINCTSEDGTKIEGFYEGSLLYIDYTVDTKSTKKATPAFSKRKN